MDTECYGQFSLTQAVDVFRLMKMLTKQSGVRSTAAKVAFVLAIYMAMISVPYLFPAPLSISRSYISGFSNRVAIILLFVGTALFAAFTRGEIGRQADVDSKLGWRSLCVALLFTLFWGFKVCQWKLTALPGGEALYFTNRIQLLLAGVVPYKQFEFVYGPLLLYPIAWLQRAAQLTTIRAYDITWLLFWQVGVVMLWTVVRGIDLPIPYRGRMLALLLGMQLAFSMYGGVSYTPFRAYFSSFCIVIIYQLWKRIRNAWVIALITLVFIVLGICCSMDQAIGIAIGAFAIMAWLWLSPERQFPWQAIVLAVGGTLVCFYIADSLNLTEPLRSFGGGGYSYPLLPSLGNFLALSAYIVAGCVLLRTLYFRLFAHHTLESPVGGSAGLPIAVPMTLAGCSMIPNALGRCDLLHISAAIPAFVVGIATIFAIPGLRRWWLPAACFALVVLPWQTGRLARYVPLKIESQRDPALVAQGYTHEISDNQFYTSDRALTENQLPCDHQYFSPSYMPVSTDTFLPGCLDTGYYLGVVDVITPKTIEFKVQELREHASQPLLMENSPLEAQLPLQLANNASMYAGSETVWVPPVRHAPLTYAPIIQYIRQHYVPGPVLLDGRIRVWYPIGSPEAQAMAQP